MSNKNSPSTNDGVMFYFIFAGVSERPKLPDGIPPRFPKKPTIKQDGNNLVLECILEANPLPEITWYRKDKVKTNLIVNALTNSFFDSISRS